MRKFPPKENKKSYLVAGDRRKVNIIVYGGGR